MRRAGVAQYIDQATGWTNGVRFPAGARNFSLRHCSISLPSNVCRGLFLEGKVAGAWNGPLTST